MSSTDNGFRSRRRISRTASRLQPGDKAQKAQKTIKFAEMSLSETAALVRSLQQELRRVIVGQDR